MRRDTAQFSTLSSPHAPAVQASRARRAILGERKIQEEGEAHDPCVDARISMRLYQAAKRRDHGVAKRWFRHHAQGPPRRRPRATPRATPNAGIELLRRTVDPRWRRAHDSILLLVSRSRRSLARRVPPSPAAGGSPPRHRKIRKSLRPTPPRTPVFVVVRIARTVVIPTARSLARRHQPHHALEPPRALYFFTTLHRLSSAVPPSSTRRPRADVAHIGARMSAPRVAPTTSRASELARALKRRAQRPARLARRGPPAGRARARATTPMASRPSRAFSPPTGPPQRVAVALGRGARGRATTTTRSR